MYENPYPHLHCTSMQFLEVEHFCNTEQHCRPRSAIETSSITQRLNGECCLYQNRFPHFIICTRDFLVKRCFNIEWRHRPRTAPKTHGIPQRLHEQEWVYILLTGVCINIDIRISIICPRDLFG